jgi:hypothetical protein
MLRQVDLTIMKDISPLQVLKALLRELSSALAARKKKTAVAAWEFQHCTRWWPESLQPVLLQA